MYDVTLTYFCSVLLLIVRSHIALLVPLKKPTRARTDLSILCLVCPSSPSLLPPPFRPSPLCPYYLCPPPNSPPSPFSPLPSPLPPPPPSPPSLPLSLLSPSPIPSPTLSAFLLCDFSHLAISSFLAIIIFSDEYNRVKLNFMRGVDGSDYINASFIDVSVYL